MMMGFERMCFLRGRATVLPNGIPYGGVRGGFEQVCIDTQIVKIYKSVLKCCRLKTDLLNL